MQPQDVTRVLSDPLAQELMQSSIPARLAYLGPDGFPRAIPIAFHWNGIQFVLCTVPHAPKVSALQTIRRWHSPLIRTLFRRMFCSCEALPPSI